MNFLEERGFEIQIYVRCLICPRYGRFIFSSSSS